MKQILLKVLGIPAGILGVGLTLAGCTLGGWWLVVLSKGRSAAKLPDPITITYPVIMLAIGVVLLIIAAICLAIHRLLQRGSNGNKS